MKNSSIKAKIAIFSPEGKVLFAYRKGTIAHKVDLPSAEIIFNSNLFADIKNKIKSKTNIEINIKKITRVWQNPENNKQDMISLVATAPKSQLKKETKNKFEWIDPNDKNFIGYPEWLIDEVALAESLLARKQL